MQSLPEQFFTIESLATLAGATGATFTITNTCQRAFGFNPAWLGLVVAQVICLALVSAVATGIGDWLIAVINACLVYLSAAGATDGARLLVTGNTDAVPRGDGDSSQEKSFLSPWFR